ncbi:oligoendopeptidase F [Romboutsia sp. 1001216sp1]|uniref:oligoendopeptidase F n=1 Tax=Romboutsia TaxID=1501226 RepID=UPI000AEE91C9|nr:MULTISPECIES: oligoendopeptidase F [Romboutsia]MDB8789249.1 oligoendopeptidase F [Romboutsia sp. 1001216sp1]MDB8793251.1 oligoendopeptidase F [Romboutsia sp. 1001216sp1]MDB8796043.1 oligoendopeptidase F [Romboutsia sp. 1001216sp1]MDB8799539.1 oligoendopeptidase F [Romboutsia sp. 1001216sp1]MDB8802175.1 oligoendopeptidase F [Romboutsia sp. 1001216sp1]
MGLDRSKIEDKFKWNLEQMYKNKDEVEKDISKVKELIQKAKEYKGKLAESFENLYNALNISEQASRLLQNLYVYTHMKQHEDTRINENQGLATKTDMLATELSTATSYMVPEIIAIEEEKLKEFMKDEKLSFYEKHIKEILREKPHTLSESEEEILAAASDITKVSEDVYDMFSFADLEFPEIEDEEGNKVKLTHSNYSVFLKSKNPRVRKDAFEAMYLVYGKYKNTFASTLYGGIKSEIFYSKIRKYKSALEASLFQDDISVDVYNNLIKAVDESLPTLNKYVDLKKMFLGLEEIHMYDLYVPLTDKFDMKITYEEAKEIILNALKPLGDEYLKLIQRAFDERWIDVYENEGKQGGAYSWGSYDSHPYILMSYKDDLNSLFTLIHELGHSMHSYYSRTTQPYIYSSYKIFVAEVASTLNELLLINYLLENSKSKEETLYLLNYYLEQFRTTVYRQTMFAEFEKITHESVESGEPLTAKEFTDIYYKLNEKYYKESCVVDEQIGLEWARIPHFYSNFYVYKYATGFSAASALSKQILEEGKPAVERYIEFLKSGGSEYPLDQLRKAGVDMEKKESVEEALQIFKGLVDKLEKEYKG